jgi:transcriptional regulator with XRE-family HTH domain
VVRGRKNPLHFGFAQRLKRARRRAKLSHAALARLAGLGSRTTTGLLEKDEHTPRVDTVEKLAKALDVAPSLLAFGLVQPASQSEALLCAGFPHRLHAIRTAQGLTLSELGRRAGSTASQAQKMEQGRAVPTLATVEQFANALQLSPGWLAFGLGEMTLPNPRRTKMQDRAETSPQQAP